MTWQLKDVYQSSLLGPIVSYSLVTTYWRMADQQESDSHLLVSVHTLITPLSTPRGNQSLTDARIELSIPLLTGGQVFLCCTSKAKQERVLQLLLSYQFP